MGTDSSDAWKVVVLSIKPFLRTMRRARSSPLSASLYLITLASILISPTRLPFSTSSLTIWASLNSTTVVGLPSLITTLTDLRPSTTCAAVQTKLTFSFFPLEFVTSRVTITPDPSPAKLLTVTETSCKCWYSALFCTCPTAVLANKRISIKLFLIIGLPFYSYHRENIIFKFFILIRVIF